MTTKEIGDKGEAIAKQYLIGKGYRIITGNYRCHVGEIDIIAEDGDTLVFVEVRSKSRTNYGTPIETINKDKQRKIRRTAEHYLVSTGQMNRFCRFDVVSVIWKNGNALMEIYQNAF